MLSEDKTTPSPSSKAFDPESERAFWRSLFEMVPGSVRVICAVCIAGPVAITGAMIAAKGIENVSFQGIGASLCLSVVAAVTLLFTRTKYFRPHYQVTIVTFFLATAAVLVATALLALPAGRKAALDGLFALAFFGTLLSVGLRKKIVLITLAFVAMGFIRVKLLDESPLYEVGRTVIFSLLTTLVAAIHEKIARQSFLLRLTVAKERDRSDKLLRNIFPSAIYEKIKDQVDPTFVQQFQDVSILFADLVGFTPFCAERSADEVVTFLNEIMSRLDATCSHAGALKIKTIGDAYMAVAGLPDGDPEHPFKIADLALEIREAVAKYASLRGVPLQVRIGIHSGPVVAGIIGRTTSHFDLWGDTVNTAARLEASSLPNKIQVSAALARRLAERYELSSRGKVALKGKGEVEAFLLERPLLIQATRRDVAA